jgi:hypothetical protein
MNRITNDREMRQALERLDTLQLRLVGAAFINGVMDLCHDEHLRRALEVVQDPEASGEALKAAQKPVNVATLNSHARCGAEGDWYDQANYFIGRALLCVLGCQDPKRSRDKNPAWQVAMACRMARLSGELHEDNENPEQENRNQYAILTAFLERL